MATPPNRPCHLMARVHDFIRAGMGQDDAMTTPVPPAALTPHGWRYLTPHGWVVTKTKTAGNAQPLYAHPATRDSLIAALAELEPGMMVVEWTQPALGLSETSMRELIQSEKFWLSGLRPPSQPAKEPNK